MGCATPSGSLAVNEVLLAPEGSATYPTALGTERPDKFLKVTYFFLLECFGACESADPAAVFEAFPERPSLRTFDAAFAAADPVCFLFATTATTS